LVCMVTAYASYWWYVPSLETPVMAGDVVASAAGEAAAPATNPPPPSWIYLWNGISMLVYQTLDNMDGKQARRTRSSSPLGLLFDHGCDAVNSIFGSANWIIGMALVPGDCPLETWILIFGPFALFYISTWEQYFTGQLVMPVVNGPNEGLLGGALLSFASWWWGSHYWQQTTWFDAIRSSLPPPLSSMLLQEAALLLRGSSAAGAPALRNCDVVVMAASVGFVQEIVTKGVAVTRRYGAPAALALLPFLILASSYLAIGWMDPSVWLNIPRTSLHLAMVLFVEMSTDMMLAHVTAQPFRPYRWQVVPLVGLTAWVALGGRNGEVLQYWILAYAWSMGAYLTMKCTLVIHEMCQVLEIWCFDIVTPHPKKNARTNSGGCIGTSRTDLKED
jgi:ethanolaminephosphotransferase